MKKEKTAETIKRIFQDPKRFCQLPESPTALQDLMILQFVVRSKGEFGEKTLNKCCEIIDRIGIDEFSATLSRLILASHR